MKLNKKNMLAEYKKTVYIVQNMNDELDKVRNLLDINSDFITAIHAMMDRVIDVTENQFEDTFNMLSWFIFDNDMGKNKFVVYLEKEEFVIKTVKDLVEYCVKIYEEMDKCE